MRLLAKGCPATPIQTRTLAKLADHIAKGAPELQRVCDLTDPVAYEHWLCRIDVAEEWGIGRASRAKLEAMGVGSVADLRDLEPRPVRRSLTVVGPRIIHELRGLACLPLEMVPAQRKGCAVSRTFSVRIEDRATLEEAVCAHATRLGQKLRREKLATNHVAAFYYISEHARDAPMRSVSTTVTLPEHTSDTLALIKAARHGVAKTWREPGERPWLYPKAGIVTNDLVRLSHSPHALIGAMGSSWRQWTPAARAGAAAR